MYNIFFQPVSSIITMKETARKALTRLKINNIRDLIFTRPYSYVISDTSPNLSDLRDGRIIQTRVTIREIQPAGAPSRPTKIYVENDTGGILLIFFQKIPPFIYNKLKIGSNHVIKGRVQYFNNSFQITHPDFILSKSLNCPVEPVYHLTYGLVNSQLYNYILSAINAVELGIYAKVKFGKESSDGPWSIDCGIFGNEQKYMTSLLSTIKHLHLIDGIPNGQAIEKSLQVANSELAERELFANQVALAKLKKEVNKVAGRSFLPAHDLKKAILDRLGFALTSAQVDSIKQIENDQASNIQMMRLLQGDVGSGKTLIALLTMINVVKHGAQSVLMAPTDLLSVQHYQFFSKALEGTGFKISLLTGKTSAKDKKNIYRQLENGEINILIGTHALFQENVIFKDLGYIVIDEQHRFGVEQRMELINKAKHPDVLVMTATPIPRSLALTMFGDMDITVVKEKPKNRLPIITSVIGNNKREKILESLQKKISLNQKIYWICPLIDQSDKNTDSDSADNYICADVVSVFEGMKALYPNQVGILHGKIKAAEKDLIMDDFKNGRIKILVATTVIEVGIDIPDATLIVIENAEKFGLAQLHQLRGRVGRGDLQSYCILMYEVNRLSAIAKQRLSIMKNSNDGFYISEQDLLLRGGGEILGTKQSGEPNFFFADLKRDIDILLKVDKLAKNIPVTDFIDFQIRLFAKENENITKSG